MAGYEGQQGRRGRLAAWLGAILLGAGLGTANAQEARSIDDLFGGPAPAPKPSAPAAAPAKPAPASIDDLFGGPAAKPPAAGTTPAAAPAAPPALADLGAAQPAKPAVTGFYQNDLAYTFARPRHWSRFNNMLDLAVSGKRDGFAYKLGGRVNYDPIYDLTDHYPRAVRDDQRFEAMVREAYVDFGAGDLEFRIGRQHVVWGEVVGLFVADVVSAKDLRQSALPDFDIIRTPQWAARAEYFAGSFHAEAVWIPSMTYNDIGKPGAEFYPFAIPAGASVAKERKPRGIDDAGYGLRLSYLESGWDVTGFYYSANDLNPAFERLSPILYQPIHKRIHQTGLTVSKDLGPAIFKGEAVHTRDRLFGTFDPADADGLVKQDTVDWLLSLEWSLPQETRFNAQFFQRYHLNHDRNIGADRAENAISFLFSTQALHPRLEPRLLFLHSLNRSDYSAQFKLTWRATGNWRLAAGVDVFEGSPNGLFGYYDSKDRVYTEVRYTF
ncbi:MAG: DUF1302 family protein [Pseudomonadota bacterium]